MNKLRSKRGWLEDGLEKSGEFKSGSSYTIVIGKDSYNKGQLDVSFTDCSRKINWYFGKPGDKAGVAKITRLKKLVDEMYDYMTNVPEKAE